MAKKILYKVTAYHCPRCGGITEPTKKYCEYCERDLAIRSEHHGWDKVRLLIDCGDFVYHDSIKRIDFHETPQVIETSCLEDGYRRYIKGNEERRFTVKFLLCKRSLELLKLNHDGLHKIRLEHLGRDIGYEQECYVSHYLASPMYSTYSDLEEPVNLCYEFVGVGESTIGTAIPKEVLSDMRCKNCGAPIKSRYGACDYCGGWNECEW